MEVDPPPSGLARHYTTVPRVPAIPCAQRGAGSPGALRCLPTSQLPSSDATPTDDASQKRKPSCRLNTQPLFTYQDLYEPCLPTPHPFWWGAIFSALKPKEEARRRTRIFWPAVLWHQEESLRTHWRPLRVCWSPLEHVGDC